jgi:hypothetical protein
MRYLVLAFISSVTAIVAVFLFVDAALDKEYARAALWSVHMYALPYYAQEFFNDWKKAACNSRS